MRWPLENSEAIDINESGLIVGLAFDDDFILPNGQIDIAKLHPISRMGYQDYSEVTSETVFTMERPGFRE